VPLDLQVLLAQTLRSQALLVRLARQGRLDPKVMPVLLDPPGLPQQCLVPQDLKVILGQLVQLERTLQFPALKALLARLALRVRRVVSAPRATRVIPVPLALLDQQVLRDQQAPTRQFLVRPVLQVLREQIRLSQVLKARKASREIREQPEQPVQQDQRVQLAQPDRLVPLVLLVLLASWLTTSRRLSHSERPLEQSGSTPMPRCRWLLGLRPIVS